MFLFLFFTDRSLEVPQLMILFHFDNYLKLSGVLSTGTVCETIKDTEKCHFLQETLSVYLALVLKRIC